MPSRCPYPESPNFPARFQALSALEQAQALARAKRRHQRRYEKAAHGGDRRSAAFQARREQKDCPSAHSTPDRTTFANFVAWRLGCTPRSVQIGVRIAERIPPALQAVLVETAIADRKNDLVRISAMTPKQHTGLLERLKDAPKTVTLDEVLRSHSGPNAA